MFRVSECTHQSRNWEIFFFLSNLLFYVKQNKTNTHTNIWRNTESSSNCYLKHTDGICAYYVQCNGFEATLWIGCSENCSLTFLKAARLNAVPMATEAKDSMVTWLILKVQTSRLSSCQTGRLSDWPALTACKNEEIQSTFFVVVANIRCVSNYGKTINVTYW